MFTGCKRICDRDFRDHKELSNRRKIRFDESNTALIEIGLLEPPKAWAKRRYAAHLASTDCDGENSDTDSPLDFPRQCGCISPEQHHALTRKMRRDWPNAALHDQKARFVAYSAYECGFGVRTDYFSVLTTDLGFSSPISDF